MKSKLKIETRVRSLKAYLEEFELGKIQIPSFQRDFVWSQDQIIELFDSIKNNYPIGSIQFWKPLENASKWMGKTAIGPYNIKSANKTEEPVYILDGFQRLSSLFGCLINPNKYNKLNLALDSSIWKKTFNLYYDLEEEEFTYLNNDNKPYQVPVYVFINSVDFRQYSRTHLEKIEDEKKIEEYLDRADELGQVFTNYQIASVDIKYASIEEAVEIFKRVNSTGQRISKDWIVSALTNRDGFRLGSEIDQLLEDLKVYNFDKIKRDVIFQCIQNSFGKFYRDNKIENLVRQLDFIEGTRGAIKAIRKAVAFLYEELLVLDSKLLPYNSQLVFIVPFFKFLGDEAINEKQRLALKRWFWVTSYSNYFTIYNISKQRKAHKKLNKFIEGESENPVYYDTKSNFVLQDFPNKINKGSVRSKALALFMINYAMNRTSLSVSKIEAKDIDMLKMGNLFSNQNTAENFVPIIQKTELFHLADKSTKVSLIQMRSKLKNYSKLLIEGNNYENLFLTEKMGDIYDESKKSEEKILSLRKDMITEAEQIFVEDLNIGY